MNCVQCRKKLPAFVDGQLGRLATWRFRRHLRRCPSCRSELDAVRSVVEKVQELPIPHRSERFWENFHKRVMASLPQEPQPRRRRLPSRPVVPILATAAAALAAVFVLRWPTGTDEWAPEDWAGQELFAVAPWHGLSEDDLTVVLEEMEENQAWPPSGRAALVAAHDASPWETLDLLNTNELVELLEVLEKPIDGANA